MHFVCANIFGAIVLKPRFKIDVVIMIVRHVTGNDKDYLRKSPEVVFRFPAFLNGPLRRTRTLCYQAQTPV